MKRWVAIALSIGLVTAVAAVASAEDAGKAKADEKVTYTFKDQDELQQFNQLFIIKQNILTRLAVLQAYASQEAANLEQVNGQLFLKFKVDPNKSYTLDADKRVLSERPTPPPVAQSGGGAVAPMPAPVKKP